MASKSDAFIRLFVSFALHVLQYCSNIVSMVIFWQLEQWKFFWACLFVWSLTGILLTLAAHTEDQELCLFQRMHPILKWPLMIFAYGLLHGLQVEHMYKAYLRRVRRNPAGNAEETVVDVSHGDSGLILEPIVEDAPEPAPRPELAGTPPPNGSQGSAVTPNNGRAFPLLPRVPSFGSEAASDDVMPYHVKTFEAILTGLPFAFFNMFTWYLLDGPGSKVTCPWFIQHTNPVVEVRVFLMIASCCSICTVAAGILELDYRLMLKVREMVDESKEKTAIHFLFRMSEATWRISFIILGCVFLRPVLWRNTTRGGVVTETLAPYELCIPIVVLIVIYAFTILRQTKDGMWDRRRESFLSKLVVAFALIVVNPAHFVEKPGFVKTARRLNISVFFVRLLEVVGVAAFATLERNLVVKCLGDPQEIGNFVISHQPGVLQLAVSGFIVYYALLLCNTNIRAGLNPHSGDSVMEFELLQPETGGRISSSSVRVRDGRERRGLSSYLLQLGGLTAKLFDDPADRPSVLRVLSVLGKGTFGSVVQVNIEGRQYAMKLQQWSQVARREGAIGKYLCTLKAASQSRYIVDTVLNFKVQSERSWATEDGTPVGSGFNLAIIMEYIEGPWQNLQRYILHHALEEDSTGVTDDASHWLRTSWRFGKEIVEAMRFLHQQQIVHRDLKPDNILLKRWQACNVTPHQYADGQDHVCVADFGYGKMLTVDGHACTCATGAPGYAAPEIPRPGHPFSPYTKKVDVYSFGVIMYVMLTRKKRRGRNEYFLVVPDDAQRPNTAGLHTRAKDLINKTTRHSARERPTFDQIQEHCFFEDFELLTVVTVQPVPVSDSFP